MADAVTSTTLSDSDRSAVIQLTNTSDGTGEAAVKRCLYLSPHCA